MRIVARLTHREEPSLPTRVGVANPIRGLDDIAAQLHDRILDRLDLPQVIRLDKSELRLRLGGVVGELVAAERIPLAPREREALVQRIVDEITGLGPLEELLADPSISDVLVNTADEVWIERRGRLHRTEVRFRDEAHLMHTIRRIAAGVGRRIDESSPMVDARLDDGSRVNAIVPPLAIDGPLLSIRRFGQGPLSTNDLVAGRALDPTMLAYLRAVVRARLSLLVSGGTGAGKTTMLNALSSFIPDSERIITIEDAAELRLQQAHVCRLESRPPNLEGRGAVTTRELVRNALRMRPDRIVIGEVRGDEVLDMLQAMNTGHEGSMATVHANSARDAISRLVTMLSLSGAAFSESTMAQLIERALSVVVHVTRGADGQRRVSSILEVVGRNGANVELRELYAWVPEQGFVRRGQSAFGERLRLESP
jgi:pilus assembly protein CpaF